MSVLCHVCGPVKHEAPTVICAPCALAMSSIRSCTEHRSAYQCANCALVFCMYCDVEQPADREMKTIGSKFCPACEACPEDA